MCMPKQRKMFVDFSNILPIYFNFTALYLLPLSFLSHHQDLSSMLALMPAALHFHCDSS
jgi:hypothetical protein